ncbi:unnamed protein product [Rhizophagus irregularis]|nr:unnamed protein product [Rhizophagus irregularis]
MSRKTEISLFIKGVHSQITDSMSKMFFDGVKTALVTFIHNGFLKQIFSKSDDGTLDKATLLMATFGDGTGPKYFAKQSKVTNIQPMTFSLIMSITFHAIAAEWNAYTRALCDNEQEVLKQSEFNDSENSGEDYDR